MTGSIPSPLVKVTRTRVRPGSIYHWHPTPLHTHTETSEDRLVLWKNPLHFYIPPIPARLSFLYTGSKENLLVLPCHWGQKVDQSAHELAREPSHASCSWHGKKAFKFQVLLLGLISLPSVVNGYTKLVEPWNLLSRTFTNYACQYIGDSSRFRFVQIVWKVGTWKCLCPLNYWSHQNHNHTCAHQ